MNRAYAGIVWAIVSEVLSKPFLIANTYRFIGISIPGIGNLIVNDWRCNQKRFIIGLKVEVVSIIAIPESEVLIIIFTSGELYMDIGITFQDNNGVIEFGV
jgi:hypothetical protein